MRILLEHPEQFIANNKNLGRAHHVFAALGTAGAVALGATAATAAAVGTGAAALGTAAVGVGGTLLANSMSKKGGAAGGGNIPSYKASGASSKPITSQQVGFNPIGFNPVGGVEYNPTQGSSDLLANYPNLAQFAQQATAFRTGQREGIMPGSGKQFQLASGVVQDWLGGNVGSDAVDFTNRQVAERTGGGFNPWTGGGNSQQDFARRIGKLASDFQQMGISSSLALQQLANSFVVGVEDTARLALGFSGQRYSYDALNANINQFNSSGQQRSDMFNSEGNMKAGMFNSEMDVKTQMANQGQGNYIDESNYRSGTSQALWEQNQANLQNAQTMGWANLGVNAATGLASSMSGYRSPASNTAASAAWQPSYTKSNYDWSGYKGGALS